MRRLTEPHEKPKPVLICAPADEPGIEVPAGSIRICCGRCGCEVWMTPASQRANIENVLCVPCAFDVVPHDTVVGVIEGREEEVADVQEKYARKAALKKTVDDAAKKFNEGMEDDAEHA